MGGGAGGGYHSARAGCGAGESARWGRVGCRHARAGGGSRDAARRGRGGCRGAWGVYSHFTLYTDFYQRVPIYPGAASAPAARGGSGSGAASSPTDPRHAALAASPPPRGVTSSSPDAGRSAPRAPGGCGGSPPAASRAPPAARAWRQQTRPHHARLSGSASSPSAAIAAPPPQRGHLDIPARGFSLGAVPASSRKPAGHTMQHERISENSLSASSSCLLLPDRRHRKEGSRGTSPGCCNHAGGPRASPPRPVPQSSSRSDTAACLQSNRWRTRAIKPAPHNPLGPRRMAGGNPWPTLATEGCDGGPKCVSLPVYLANSMVY